MRVRLLVAVALLVTVSYATAITPAGTDEVEPAVAQLAVEKYGTTLLVTVPAADPLFHAAFPSYPLYVVYELTRYPPIPHAMAVNPVTSIAYDVTRDWNRLMLDSGAAVLTADDALRFGLAYAQTANTEFQLVRSVVHSSDSAALNRSVDDPEVVLLVGAWLVEASTWSPENGVLADWTISLTGSAVTSAFFDIRDVGVGPKEAVLEATNFAPDVLLLDQYDGLSHTLTASKGGQSMRLPDEIYGAPCTAFAERANFDGSRWVACYADPDHPAPPSSILTVGAALTEAGATAYSKLVHRNPTGCAGGSNPAPNLGFEAPEADCTRVVEVLTHRDLLCEVCWYPDKVQIPLCQQGINAACARKGHIFVSPTFREHLLARGYYTDPILHTTESVARVVVGHEYFHVLQFAVLDTDVHWAALLEGQARFVETLLDRSVTHHASSILYAPGATAAQASRGVGSLNVLLAGESIHRMQIAPNEALCTRSFATALLWGAAYGAEPDSSFLRTSLEEAAARNAHAASFQCAEHLSATLDAALASSPGGATSLVQLMDAFAIKSYERNFSWSSVDGTLEAWGGDSLATVRVDAAPLGDTSIAVHPWGRTYRGLPQGTLAVSCSLPAPHAGVILLHTSAGVQPLGISCVEFQEELTVTVGSGTEAVFVATSRNASIAEGALRVRLV